MSTLQPRGGLTTSWCAVAAAMAALATATTIGNAAVLVALHRSKTAPAHYPLASLAAADLLVGLFVLPVAAARELFVFQLDPLICSFWKTLDIMCCTASILSLCCLGWERWSGITAPFARARRAKRARLFAGLVWPLSLAVALPTIFIPSPKALVNEDKGCPDNTNLGYVFYCATLSFYLPAIVMVTLYARILCALSVPLQIRSHRGGLPCPDTGQTNKTPKPALKRCAASVDICFQEHQTNTVVPSPKGCQLNLPEGSKSGSCPTSPVKHPGAPYVFYCATLSFYLPAIVMVTLYARILCALSVPLQIRSHRGGLPCPDTGQTNKTPKPALKRCAASVDICFQEHQTNTVVPSPKGCQLNLPEGSKSGSCPTSPVKHPGAPCSIISRQQRATRTIIRLMALFLLCWTPFFIVLPLDSLCDCVWDSVWQWCTWLGFTNSALNPLVYAAASPSVRRALQSSLTSSVKPEVPLTPVRNR